MALFHIYFRVPHSQFKEVDSTPGGGACVMWEPEAFSGHTHCYTTSISVEQQLFFDPQFNCEFKNDSVLLYSGYFCLAGVITMI